MIHPKYGESLLTCGSYRINNGVLNEILKFLFKNKFLKNKPIIPLRKYSLNE